MTENNLQAANQEITRNIASQVEAQVEGAVSGEIEQGLVAARSGMRRVKTADGKTENQGITGIGWLDAIIGGIFSLLESIGLGKMVAGWMGSPIPEQQEVKAVSSATGKAVQHFLNDPSGKTKDEFQANMAQAVKTELRRNRSDYASLSDEQLDEIAQKTAAETTSTLSGQLFDKDGKIKIAVDENGKPLDKGGLFSALGQNAVYEKMNEVLADPAKRSQLASLLGKDNVTQSDILAMSGVIGPAMAAIESSGNVSPKDAANRIYTALKDGKQGLEQSRPGVKLTDNMMAAASYTLAADYAARKGLTLDASFKSGAAAAYTDAARDIIATKTAAMADSAIAESTAIGVRSKYEASGYLSKNNTLAYDSDDMKIFDKYYDRSTNEKGELTFVRNEKKDIGGELQATIARMNRFAAKGNNKLVTGLLTGNRGLSDEQRERVAQIIGDATARTIAQSPKPFETQQELAEAVRKNVEADLKSRTREIDQLGTPIAAINDKLSDANKPVDVIASIATGIEEKIKQPEFKEKFADIVQTQKFTQSLRKEAAELAVGAGRGMTQGGAEAATAQVQANLGRSSGASSQPSLA